MGTGWFEITMMIKIYILRKSSEFLMYSWELYNEEDENKYKLRRHSALDFWLFERERMGGELHGCDAVRRGAG